MGMRFTSLTRLCVVVSVVLLSFSSNKEIQAQVLRDSNTFRLMSQGVDYIYNMQFDKARDIFKRVSAKYPDHPIVSVYKGLITYWENFPLIPTSPEKEVFISAMEKAMELAENYPQHETDPEYLLSIIGARGLLLLFYADNDMTRDVMSLASSTYQYVKLAFNYTQTYADFYFVTGLYNYYREAYPEAHPVYKPVAILFPKGDRVKGLREMQIASKKAIVLKAEAFSFLTGIYISFENNFQQAYQYSKALHDLYPSNIYYLALYIKNLLLVKRYDEAEQLIKSGYSRSENPYFQAQLSILNGIVFEKKHKNNRQAQYYYGKGIKDIEPYGAYGNEFSAYGYFGLSRISLDKQHKKDYRKQALDLADFKSVNFDK